eukprot:gene9622-9700_t
MIIFRLFASCGKPDLARRWNMAEPAGEAALLDGRLTILQPLKGHRAGTDALLLAACTPESMKGMLVDMGAGVGTVGLVAASLVPQAKVILVEQDKTLASLAEQNVQRNDFADRMRVVAVDVLDAKARRAAGLIDGQADFLLTNPPFYEPSRVRASPLALKRSAYLMEGTLDDWMRAACSLMSAHGRMVLIHRATALPDILACYATRFGALRIKPIYPRLGEPATRILVAATKGSRAPLNILPGLVLHEGEDFTAEVQAIHREPIRLKGGARGSRSRALLLFSGNSGDKARIPCHSVCDAIRQNDGIEPAGNSDVSTLFVDWLSPAKGAAAAKSGTATNERGAVLYWFLLGVICLWKQEYLTSPTRASSESSHEPRLHSVLAVFLSIKRRIQFVVPEQSSSGLWEEEPGGVLLLLGGVRCCVWAMLPVAIIILMASMQAADTITLEDIFMLSTLLREKPLKTMVGQGPIWKV